MDRQLAEHSTRRRSIAFFLLIACLALLLAGYALADLGPAAPRADLNADTSVSFAPASLSLVPGQVVTISVQINNVTNLFGYELHMGFDPAVVQVLDDDAAKTGINITPGSFLAPGPYAVMPNEASNITGTVKFAMTLIGGTSVSGNGTLATLTLQAVAPGDAQLGLTQVNLSDDNGFPIAYSWNNASVVVLQVTPTDGPSPTPSNTPTPSVTPTASNTPTITNTPQVTATPTQGASPTPYFYLDPQTREIQPGQQFTVTVYTSYVPELSGVEVHLRWNPAVLRVVDQDPVAAGVQVTQGNIFAGYSTFAPIYNVDNVQGQLAYAYAMTEAFCVAGQWSVFTLTFDTIGLGSSQLAFFGDTLMACMGLEILPGWVDGIYDVVQATSTPTLTSTPSETPTPTLEPTIPEPTATATVVPVLSCWDAIENGDFEDTTSSAWELSGEALISTQRPRLGSYSAWLAGYNMASDVVSQAITIPTDVLTATLSFWSYVETIEVDHPHDYLYVEVRNPSGELLIVLHTLSDADPLNVWSRTSVDMTAYAGQSVRVAFRATTNATLYTHFFVDDVELLLCGYGEPTPTPAPPTGLRLWLPLTFRNRG